MDRLGVGVWECSKLERKLVNEVLDSGRLSYGPKSKEFEKQFSRIHGCKFGVLSNSGTSSLQVAVQTLKELHGWDDGDEIIVPAVTFPATINSIIHNNLNPVLVDIEYGTYNIDAEKIPAAITDNTRAIIPVHLFGQSADTSLMLEFGLKIIEDACEAAFAQHNGNPVGSWGDIGCFSFYVAHLLTTGVGGMAITNNPDYAAKMRSIVNHGRDGIYIDMDTEATEEVISKRFKFDTIGHSYRITELEAALGLAQLTNYKRMLKARRYNARYLNLVLESTLNVKRQVLKLPHITTWDNSHSWMMYPIVVYGESKWGLVNHLEKNGIETREMLPLINQPCYRGMWNPDDYPIAQFIDKSGFYIGIHQGLTEEDLDNIVDTIYGYFNGY